MKGVCQIRKADCFVACIASMFDLKVKDLPYIRPNRGQWWEDWTTYLSKYNIRLLKFDNTEECNIKAKTKYMICRVHSRRRGYYHAVIARNDKIVFDPNPKVGWTNSAGKRDRRKILRWYTLTPLDPSKPMRSPKLKKP